MLSVYGCPAFYGLLMRAGYGGDYAARLALVADRLRAPAAGPPRGRARGARALGRARADADVGGPGPPLPLHGGRAARGLPPRQGAREPARPDTRRARADRDVPQDPLTHTQTTSLASTRAKRLCGARPRPSSPGHTRPAA